MRITKHQLRRIIREVVRVNRTCLNYQRLSEAKVSQAELDEILADHQLWHTSGSSQGNRADLQEADLRGADLLGVKLDGANLDGAKMPE